MNISDKQDEYSVCLRQQPTTQNIMHALHFDLNKWGFKLRHRGWNDEASIDRHALYSNVGNNAAGSVDSDDLNNEF